MMLLNTSLLRERFTIKDTNGRGNPKIAIGNRLLLPLSNAQGTVKERFIIRAQSMHMCLRMGAFLADEFYRLGPLLNRQIPIRWQDVWYDMTNEFERLYNPSLWCAIYHNGRPIFQSGNYHSFLDVIEQCDIKNRAEYDRAIYIAQDIFKDAGKDVRIDHDVNIGLVIGAMEDRLRCGVILRSPSHTSTFNFKMEEKTELPKKLLPHHGLELASCYLEGIQLAVLSGITKNHSHSGTIPQKSIFNRIGRLNQSIDYFEKAYAIRYRPEKPDLQKVYEDSISLSRGQSH